jgi:hypothetical protein
MLKAHAAMQNKLASNQKHSNGTTAPSSQGSSSKSSYGANACVCVCVYACFAAKRWKSVAAAPNQKCEFS